MPHSSLRESLFFYGLARPYPFSWFTPAAVVVRIIAVAAFSFLNVATAGYNKIVVVTSDPNATIANGTFFSDWPSYLSARMRATCELKILVVNGKYYTNNTAYLYRLNSAWQNDRDGG